MKMNYKILKIIFITTKTSFCYVSEHNSCYTAEKATLKLTHKSRVSYFTAQVSKALTENEIGINRVQAELLDMQENEDIMVNICMNMPGISRLVISPDSEEDYEIVDLLSESIQSTLLDQIRVVNLNQKFIIWMSNSLHVLVNVDSVEPVNPGCLDNLTEVEVTVPKNILNSKKLVTEKLAISTNFLHKYMDISVDICFALRVSQNFDNNRHFDVYVHRTFLPQHFDNGLYNVELIEPPNKAGPKNATVYLVILDALIDYHCVPIMHVHACLLKNFNVLNGAKVLLTQMKNFKSVINKIELTVPVNKNHSQVVDMLKKFVEENSAKRPLLFNANYIIDTDNLQFSLQFFPRTNFCLVDSNLISKRGTIEVSNFELTSKTAEEVSENGQLCESFGNCKEIVSGTINSVTLDLKDGESGNVLIIGKQGTGKTCLTKLCINKLSAHPYYLYTETILCKTIKGKSLESLHKLFSIVMLNLVYYQPSILILDDLQAICGKVIEDDALTQESLYFNRVSEMVAELIETYTEGHKIAFIATAESTFALNHNIYAAQGLHLFKNIHTIDSLEKEDCAEISKFLLEETCEVDDIDFDELSIKMEGFVIQDVADFGRKAAFECLKELLSKPKLTMEHCKLALQKTEPLSLQNVQLFIPGDRNFNDIGGLDDIKTILTQTILWPIKYPHIFDNAPLKLQTGLLLYGPPGTGKTILAGATAKEFGLRLISIKGPELLSKYIGASEEAVRNTFEKAQNAKPCILFFDEFDSLAPRRGHDSTGVTDRVVNQLLTQLDGIETLNGVFVIAATSRPELLDPALLRPGRLDKQIECNLPNEEARLNILYCLAKNMNLGSDVNFVEIAEKSEGFSGADLQAVLYSAQLAVVQEVTSGNEEDVLEIVKLRQKYLVDALKSTRPSLTPQDLHKYRAIYDNFKGGRMVDAFKGSSQRATLA